MVTKEQLAEAREAMIGQLRIVQNFLRGERVVELGWLEAGVLNEQICAGFLQDVIDCIEDEKAATAEFFRRDAVQMNVEREIDEEEAALRQRIFDLIASGTDVDNHPEMKQRYDNDVEWQLGILVELRVVEEAETGSLYAGKRYRVKPATSERN